MIFREEYTTRMLDEQNYAKKGKQPHVPIAVTSAVPWHLMVLDPQESNASTSELEKTWRQRKCSLDLPQRASASAAVLMDLFMIGIM